MTDTAQSKPMTRRSTAALYAALAIAVPLNPALAQQQPSAPAPGAAPATAPAATTQPLVDTRPSNGAAATTRSVTTQPGGGLILNFNNASIDSVLDELSAVAGFIVVKETPLTGRVTLVSKQPVKAEEAVNLLNTVLKNAGYAAIQQGRTLKVVAHATAKKANIPVRSGADPSLIEPTDELITQVIPLRQVDATQLRQDLQPLISADADFTANASSNTIVITDTSANIKRIVEIVAALDSSLVGAAEVKVFQLKYATAATAARMINDLFGESARSRGQQQGQQPSFGFGGFPGGFSRGGDPRSGSSRGGNQENARAAIRVNASSDDRTNTVVVTGPPETLLVIEKVVRELDENPAAEETVFIYKLKNGQALNVEYVLNVLFNGTAGGRTGSSAGSRGTGLTNTRSGAASSSRSNQRGSGGIGSTGGRGSTGGFGGTGGFGSTGGFGGTSRFGGSTGGFGGGFGGVGGVGGFGGFSAGAQSAASALAGQVSVIADEDTNSLLVRTGPKNFEQVRAILDELDRAVPQVLIKVLIAEVTHDNNIDVGAQFSIINLRGSGVNSPIGGTNFGLASQTSGLVVSILEENFTATLRALETEGKLDVLSRPYILASDNQLASITVGQEVAFITRSQLTDEGQTINTIQYDDIGILLDVVPHINPDGLVILDVAPEISALTGSSVPISDTVSAPTIAKRSAQSRVGVMNGQTIVIGGLMEDRKTSTVNKVPILGDIPFVGNLFKRTQQQKVKTELLIFLTPHVAAMPDQLKGMSKDELDGTKLTPNAVEPGAFQDHMRGMQRGATPIDPNAPKPSTQPLAVPMRGLSPDRGEGSGADFDPGQELAPGADFGPGPVAPPPFQE